ncbi:MAG: amino acid permease [Candidatus Berkiellales bacterium]
MPLRNAIGGVGLIASTAIGAAILALPVATAHLGFTYTALFFFVCWCFMTLGALYVLEANLAVGRGTNLISMAEKTLGPWGKYFTWCVYLSLLYALVAAHLAGAGAWIHQELSYFHLAPFNGAMLMTFIIIIVILMGTFVIDWVNRLLLIGLISIFISLVFTTLPHVESSLLFSQPTVFDLRPIPIIITAFGSAIVIPSLTEYLRGSGRQLVWVVLGGSLIPLLVYVSWEFAIVGIIPMHGMPGLVEIQQHGHPVTDVPLALQHLLHNVWISRASSYFSIFALTASFLGLCLSLIDFLADGLDIHKNIKGKLILIFIAFVPPLVFILFYPHGFTIILSLAGFFVALLLGVLPASMVWSARYRLTLPSNLQIIGGKFLLLLTITFFIIVIGIESYNQWQML